MKINRLLLFLFILTGSLSFAQKIKGRSHELTGRIINNLSLPPNCGYTAFAYIIEFEIINSDMKNYIGKQIPVIVGCPELFGENFFKKNNIYKLIISDKKQSKFGWTIPNLKILNQYNLKTKFWLINAEKQD